MKKMTCAFVVICLLVLASICPALATAERSVPQLISYHATATDDGGNPIPDGEVGAWFRIFDAAGNALYEERQQITALGGHVAALIGNGLTVNGAPTGGVPLEVLDPTGARYLEVAIDGTPATSHMEIAAAPYASYAQMALRVADGSIDANAIADKGIAFQNLSTEAIKGLAGALASGAASSPFVTESAYRAPESAAKIGIAGGLAYSSADNLQGALHDLDHAIAQREAAEGGKLSRAGDTMSGTLAVQGDIVMAEGRTVDGVDVNIAVGSLQQQIAAIDNPARLPFQRSAYGSVTISYGQAQVDAGNASAQMQGASRCRVWFQTPMSNAHYAVTVTPVSASEALPAASVLSLFEKSADGFTVMVASGALSSFDFVALGF